MVQLIIISLGILLIFQTSMHKASAYIAWPLHQACLNQLPEMSAHHALMAGIVCGEAMPNSSASYDFQMTGLVHLIIVSGAHLLLIERTLNWGQKKLFKREVINPYFTFAVLCLYALVTLLQPPVVRALFSFLVARLSKQKKLFLRPAQLTAMAGFATLAYAPEWCDSLSLRLSWLAALALQLPFKINSKRLARSIAIYVFMFPLIISFNFPHPISIACNWLLGPLFGGLLFPVSVLATTFHWLTPLSDLLWSALEGCLHIILSFIEPIEWTFLIPVFFQWIYLGSLQISFIQLEQGQK